MVRTNEMIKDVVKWISNFTYWLDYKEGGTATEELMDLFD